MKRNDKTPIDLELRVELLKERIYATLALLAILLTIDTDHTSPIKAAAIIAGTALSLWAASIIASRMSYRIVMRHKEPDTEELDRQFVRHSPLLVSAAFPLLMILLSFIGLVSLSVAIDVAIGSSLLLILGWSLLSARTMKAGWINTLIIAATQLALGVGIVGLKILVNH